MFFGPQLLHKQPSHLRQQLPIPEWDTNNNALLQSFSSAPHQHRHATQSVSVRSVETGRHYTHPSYMLFGEGGKRQFDSSPNTPPLHNDDQQEDRGIRHNIQYNSDDDLQAQYYSLDANVYEPSYNLSQSNPNPVEMLVDSEESQLQGNMMMMHSTKKKNSSGRTPSNAASNKTNTVNYHEHFLNDSFKKVAFYIIQDFKRRGYSNKQLHTDKVVQIALNALKMQGIKTRPPGGPTALIVSKMSYIFGADLLCFRPR